MNKNADASGRQGRDFSDRIEALIADIEFLCERGECTSHELSELLDARDHLGYCIDTMGRPSTKRGKSTSSAGKPEGGTIAGLLSRMTALEDDLVSTLASSKGRAFKATAELMRIRQQIGTAIVYMRNALGIDNEAPVRLRPKGTKLAGAATDMLELEARVSSLRAQAGRLSEDAQALQQCLLRLLDAQRQAGA